MLQKIVGVCLAYLYAGTVGRSQLEMIADASTGASASMSERLCVIMVGYSLSGKTHVVQHHPRLRTFTQVSSRNIHDLLNDRLRWMRDDRSIKGRAYWPRQVLTRIIRDRVLERLMRSGMNIVHDSCNLERQRRVQLISQARRHGYRAIVIHVACSEDRQLGRLRSADNAKLIRGETSTWQKLYSEIQVPRFECPRSDEADGLIEVESEVTELRTISI
jgi:predicted kinase